MPLETHEPEDGKNYDPNSEFMYDLKVPIEQYGIYSWSPAPPGTDHPATQVHIRIHIAEVEATFFIRLKSAQAVDELIEALTIHKDKVFPAQGTRWVGRKHRRKGKE